MISISVEHLMYDEPIREIGVERQARSQAALKFVTMPTYPGVVSLLAATASMSGSALAPPSSL